MDQRTRLDKATADFISTQKHLLKDNMTDAFVNFKRQLDKGESLTPAQHSYLDGMYEHIMGELTGEKIKLHIDLKNKHKTNLHY